MKENGAAGILGTAIDKIRNLVDTSTIIGEPIVTDGVTVIPVSKVTYGFASGGSDFPSKTNPDIFGGGGGAGITINPVAFIIIKDGDVEIKHIAGEDNSIERIVGMIPDVINKISEVAAKFGDKKDADTEPAEDISE